MVALGSEIYGAESLVEQKIVCEATETDTEASLKASENRLYDIHHHVLEQEPTKYIVDNLATTVDEDKKVLKDSQEHEKYLEDHDAEQSIQVLARHATTISKR